MDGIDVLPELIKTAQHQERNYRLVQNVVYIKKTGGDFEVLVSWTGLTDYCDYTWEPALNIAEDVPVILKELLEQFPESNFGDARSDVQKMIAENQSHDHGEV